MKEFRKRIVWNEENDPTVKTAIYNLIYHKPSILFCEISIYKQSKGMESAQIIGNIFLSISLVFKDRYKYL